MLKKLLFATLFLSACFLKSQTLELKKNWWIPNNSVEDIIKDTINDQIILAGDFNRIAPPHQHSAGANLRSNVVHHSFPQTNEPVIASVSDGEGGWYIAGDFTKVGDSNRYRLAHLNQYGHVTTRLNRIAFDDKVEGLELHEDSLYVGGSFERAGDLRGYGVAVDTIIGLTDTRYANPDGGVLASIDDGMGGFYIGGAFDHVGDSSRSKIAHILSDGTVGPPVLINTEFDGTVYDLQIHDSVLYIGGKFETTQGIYRRNLAAIDIEDQSFTDWEVEVNGSVNAITATDSMLFFGGSFDSVNHTVRLNLSAIKHNDDNSLPLFIHVTGVIINVFGRTAPGYVNCLVAKDSLVYIGGDFNIIRGQNRANFATYRLNSTTFNNSIGVTNIDFDNTVRSMHLYDSLLYIGGDFSEVNTIKREKIAAINSTNYKLDSLSIDLDDDVLDIYREDSLLYLVGRFEEIDTIVRNRVAAYNLNSDRISNWNPNADFPVYTISKNQEIIYLGGYFRHVGGMERNRFAVIDLSRESLSNTSYNFLNHISEIVANDSFLFVVEDSLRGLNYGLVNKIEKGVKSRLNLNTDRLIRDLLLKDSSLYIAGYFNRINGISRDRIAEYNIKSNSITAFEFDISGGVEALALRGNSLFIGGSLSSISGNSQYFLSEIDLQSDTVTAWNANFVRDFTGGRVNDIAFTDSTMIVAGLFDSLLSDARNNVAEIRLRDTSLTSFSPSPNEEVYSISVNQPQDIVFIGGEYTAIGGVERNFLVGLDPATGQPTDWKPAVDRRVYGLALKDSSLILAGNFNTVMGVPRRYFASLNVNTLAVDTLSPNFSSFISDFQFVGDTLFMGGSFTTINSVSHRYIAAIDWSTKALLAWNPRPSRNIRQLATDSKSLFAIGSFTNVGSFPSTVNRDGIVEFDVSNLTVSAWSPTTNGQVYDIEVNDTAIYIAGSFTDVNSNSRDYFASFNKSSKLLNPLSLNVNNTIFHISKFDNTLFLGGNFTNIYTTVNNRFNDRLAQLDPNNNSISDFRADLDRNPGVILQVDSNLLVGGYFFEVADEKQPFLAAFGSNCTAESTIDTVVACGSYTWVDFLTYTESTSIPKFTFITKEGCDSTVQLHLIVNQNTDTAFTVSQCEQYLWSVNGRTYDSTGVYLDTIPNSIGCDSILSLNLSINRSRSTDTIIACDSLIWSNGMTYRSSTSSVFDTLTNSLGCDSIVQLLLTINNSNTGIDLRVVCDSLNWIDGITYTATTNTPTFTLSNSQGCDSIVRLDLTVNPSVESTDSLVVCDSLTWIDGITYRSSTNSPSFMLTSADGCDSLVRLNLSVNPSTESKIVVGSCDSYTWNQNGATYTQSGTYLDTVKNSNGCDSVISLELTIQNNSFTEVVTACDSLVWTNGITYTSSTNTPKDTFVNKFGCDSVVSLDLTVFNSTNFVDSLSTCDSLTWIDGITYFSDTNTPFVIRTNAAGCDSIVRLSLTILPFEDSIRIAKDSLIALQFGTSYQWLNCDSSFKAIAGENKSYFIPTSTGNYACEITTSACIDTTVCYSRMITGLGSVSSKRTSIYPNPAKNEVYFEGFDFGSLIRVFNVQGELIWQFSADGKAIEKVDVSTWSKGVYLVKTEFKNSVYTEKLIVR